MLLSAACLPFETIFRGIEIIFLCFTGIRFENLESFIGVNLYISEH